MTIVLILLYFASYYYGAGRLVRWGCDRAGEAEPGWGTVICMLLWPSLLARLSRRLVPDAWGWPELWISLALWMLCLFFVFRIGFKIRFADSLLIWGACLVLAVLTTFRVGLELASGQ